MVWTALRRGPRNPGAFERRANLFNALGFPAAEVLGSFPNGGEEELFQRPTNECGIEFIRLS